jgi:YfiH family protein
VTSHPFDAASSTGGRFDDLPPAFAAGYTTRPMAPDGTPADRVPRLLAGALGSGGAEVARLVQVHGRAVIEDVSEPRPGSDRILGQADAVISRAEGRLLSVFTADCVPILLADEETGWMAAIHAGWRGTAARIVDAVIDRLEERGVAPASLFALFGPSISGEAYAVGPEVADALLASGGRSPLPGRAVVPGRGDRRHVDLGLINETFLLARGLRPERIRRPPLCTLGDPRLFPSYRRDGPGTGRIATGILRTGPPRRPSSIPTSKGAPE